MFQIAQTVDSWLTAVGEELLADSGIPVFVSVPDHTVSTINPRQTLVALIRWGLYASGVSPLIEAEAHADAIGQEFWKRLPEVRDLLQEDVKAITERDPAASSTVEVMCCYPAIVAMIHHRVAHLLHQLDVPLIPRIITERAHSATGIDIHPAATIGRAFAIDHGTGIVIGATAIIGNHVMLYQGVTLGAKNFPQDDGGQLLDLPRHPIIEDNVTIYANTTVLGRITIGHNSVIGGNLWITHDVAPFSTVRQSKPITHIGFIDGEGI